MRPSSWLGPQCLSVIQTNNTMAATINHLFSPLLKEKCQWKQQEETPELLNSQREENIFGSNKELTMYFYTDSIECIKETLSIKIRNCYSDTMQSEERHLHY